MLSSTEILTFLHENKELFQEQYGIRKIGLFGSYARGEQTDQSDVDIIIDMSSDTENIFDKRLQLKNALILHFAKNVDVCHERAIKPVFKELIFKDAIYAW